MVTREDVKNAIEYKWRGSQWKLYLSVWAVMLVISPVLGLTRNVSIELLLSYIGIVAAVYSVLWIPFVAYPLWRQWEMLRRREHYRRYEVKLCNPITSWVYKGAVGYRVVFRTEDGETLVRETKPLFSSRALATFQLDDYNNKTVDIFYDSEKDTVILVG